MKEGILYYYENDHLSLEKKIQFLVPQFVDKRLEFPEFVAINPQDAKGIDSVSVILPDRKQIVDVEIELDPQILRNHYWIGVDV